MGKIGALEVILHILESLPRFRALVGGRLSYPQKLAVGPTSPDSTDGSMTLSRALGGIEQKTNQPREARQCSRKVVARLF